MFHFQSVPLQKKTIRIGRLAPCRVNPAKDLTKTEAVYMSDWCAASPSRHAVRAGHSDGGGHRLRGLRDRGPVDRSPVVHLLAHR